LSTLYLIRHGQASFGSANYDVLSELGAEQARRLGAHFAGRGARIDACYAGPCQRQIDTARMFLHGAQQAGARYPEASQLDALDEYPAMALLARWLPRLAAESAELGSLMTAPAAPERQERLARAVEQIVQRWARGELESGELESGELEGDALESFAAFQGRVRRGLTDIMEREGRGKQVAVITSGGPIAMAMQMALGLADEVALRVAWVISNTGLSEFRYRDSERIALVRFNAVPHLPDHALLTYR
jgi:broad specificity phosphatase PhoE